MHVGMLIPFGQDECMWHDAESLCSFERHAASVAVSSVLIYDCQLCHLLHGRNAGLP